MQPPDQDTTSLRGLLDETIQQTLRAIAHVLASCILLAFIAALIFLPSAPIWLYIALGFISICAVCTAILLHNRPPSTTWNPLVAGFLLLLASSVPLFSHAALGPPHGTNAFIVITATLGTTFLSLRQLIAALLFTTTIWIGLNLEHILSEQTLVYICAIGLAISIRSIRTRTVARFQDLQQHKLDTQKRLQEAIKLAQQREEELLYQTHHDPLTSLPNRRSFFLHLQEALDTYRTDTNSARFAVLFLDLDRFKYINDSFGHAAGDILLQKIAERLRQCIPATAFAARLSGDEFAIILPTYKYNAESIAQTIHNALRPSFNIQDNEIFSSVSIGIAPAKPNYTKPEHILRDSDIAMYQAKTHGKSRKQLFSTDMHNTLVQDVMFAMELQKAARNEDLQLTLEPILQNDHPVGFQAQLSWAHPKQGHIFADDFIAIAHEFGISSKIQLQTIRSAMQWLRETHPDSTYHLRVNLSHTLLNHNNILPTLLDLCSTYTLPPQRTILSIEEHALYTLIDRDLALLESLHQHNFPLCIHNFGLKYTALNLLPLPFITHLHIHPYLLRDTHAPTLQLLRTLAHTHSLHITASQISTQAQRDALLHIQPDTLHGPLIHPPIHTDRAP